MKGVWVSFVRVATAGWLTIHGLIRAVYLQVKSRASSKKLKGWLPLDG